MQVCLRRLFLFACFIFFKSALPLRRLASPSFTYGPFFLRGRPIFLGGLTRAASLLLLPGRVQFVRGFASRVPCFFLFYLALAGISLPDVVTKAGDFHKWLAYLCLLQILSHQVTWNLTRESRQIILILKGPPFRFHANRWEGTTIKDLPQDYSPPGLAMATA